MKKLFLFVIIAGCLLPALAQEPQDKKRNKREERKQRISAMARQEEEGVITFKKHTVFGGKLTSDGYGAFLEIARAQSIKRSLLFQLEFSERKHSKEEKQQGPYSTTAPIIYGKINFFYPIKLGVQQQFLLGNKGNKNGVAVTGNIGGGLIVGLLRPYMVDVDINGTRTFVGYESADSSYYLNGPYYGGPNFGTGWSKMKVSPGFYIKPAVRFDYGKFNEMVNAIETGITIEYYSKKVPQMIYQKNKQFFFSAYFAIMFGRRK
ncbi:MAG TPA: hypothetical protein VK498_04055 [Ferruginibacter sp.]|nr:hypothetical protein [Ferruginibacter sp.]